MALRWNGGSCNTLLVLIIMMEQKIKICGIHKTGADEHVEDICQSVDISRQENKIISDCVSEVHEQEEPRNINKHDISDDSDDQGDDVGQTEDQDTDHWNS